MKHRQFAVSILSAGLVAMFGVTPALAGVTPTPFRTGLFGVTAGQAVRVSVLNARDEAGGINPCATPDPIGFVVKISNLAGKPLFESRGEPVSDGMGTFIDFLVSGGPVPNDGAPSPPGARLPDGGVPPTPVRNRRIQLRVDVELDAEHTLKAQRGDIVLTLEVFDTATGRTAFTMPFAAVGFNPQPEPPEPIGKAR